MAFHNPLDPGSVNGWKSNVSKAMKRLAASRKCPTCERGNAMGAWVRFEAERCKARKCRYCGHEQSGTF